MPVDVESTGSSQFVAYLGILRRHKWTLVVVTALCVAVAVGFSESQTPTYLASAKVLLQTSTPAATTAAPLNVADEIQRLESPRVADIVRQQLGSAPPVSGSALAGTDIMAVTASARTGVDAARVANVYANAYIKQHQAAIVSGYLDQAKVIQDQITDLDNQIVTLNSRPAAAAHSQVTSLSAQVALLQQQLISLQAQASSGSSGVQLLAPAVAPALPSSPKKVRNGLLGLGGGLVLAIALAFVRESLDDTITSKEDLARAQPGLVVLGLIPAMSTRGKRAKDLLSTTRPHAPASEAYRSLRTSVQFLGFDGTVRILQVTSPRTAEGKTTTVANLAVALAMAGQRVIAVDSDLRRPRLHEVFGLPSDVGFTSVLLEKASLSSALQTVPDHDGLRLLACGERPPNPSELLSSAGAGELFTSLGRLADVVVVDSPPILPVTDATLISAQADATLIVVSAGLTTAKDLARALEVLGQVGAPIAGSILNNVTAGGRYRYRYSYSPDPKHLGAADPG